MKKLLAILILTIVAGLFIPIVNIQAQYAGRCWSEGFIIPSTLARPINNQADCTKAAIPKSGLWWQSAGAPPPPHGPTTPTPAPTPTPDPAPTPAADTNYQLLAPLPCDDDTPGCTEEELLETFDPSGEGGGGLGSYLNLMIKLIIGICAVLAVVMIVMGGIQYMTTELISGKEEGKKRIMNAIFGLLLALGAYTLLYTINPDLLKTDLSSLAPVSIAVTERQIAQYSGQGKCEPILSGLCSPDNLTKAGFANGTEASSICNGESGGEASLASGVDRCKDKSSFSFGLFQINIIAHQNEIPGGVCSGIFKVSGGGTQGACMPGKSKNGICFERDCEVTNQAQYQRCINYIAQAANNIAYAKNLRASRSWRQWGAYNSCSSTFKER